MLDLYSGALWNRKVVEPVKRNKDGLKWIFHRFEIKGGISLRDVVIEDLRKPNPLWSMVCKR